MDLNKLKENYKGDPSEHIAIIGMVGRFPEANDIDKFWENLKAGRESVKFFTRNELAETNIDANILNNPRYVGADAVIDDMDMFDAEFFGISPREAEIMDPQHRLFLECAWELMEQAGYDSESYDGRVAVYSSANLSTYLIRNIMANAEMKSSATSFQTLICNDKDFVGTRVSYKLNLHGPSLSVASLCSSSSVAIHLACQNLLNYQCDMALAGAISLQASRNEAFFYQEGGIGDPDGHCRAFDAKAGGTVSGSGLGIIALKRLEEAVEDGDHIYAVIRGSSMNNDGALKISYTAPSVEGQAEVIAEALALGDVDPRTISYVEAHGTGTLLGDPIEVEALTKAFRLNTEDKQFCALGSVKSNIGHLVNAGGVASLIKTVQAMRHKQIPASLNFETPNPKINFKDSPFFVNDKLREWKRDETPLRAGVSSFGIGGTNVHIVLEEAPEHTPSGKGRQWQVIPLSGRTPKALKVQKENLKNWFMKNRDVNLADAAFTLQVGRRAFEHRQVVLCKTVAEAIELLDAGDDSNSSVQRTKNRPVVFLYSGIFNRDTDMLKALYEQEEIFKERIDECSAYLNQSLDWDLKGALFGSSEKLPENGEAVLAFTVQYALSGLWEGWGITPSALFGEDEVGEYTAACMGGVFSLEDALSIISSGGIQSLTGVTLNPSRVPLASVFRKDWAKEAEEATLAYWTEKDLRSRSFSLLWKEKEQLLLEVGTASPAGEAVKKDKPADQIFITAMGGHPGTLVQTLGSLWLGGVKVDWKGFHLSEHRHRLPMPTYPFERKRFWIEPAEGEVVFSKKEEGPLYLPYWKESFAKGTPVRDRVRWLVMGESSPLAEKVHALLRMQGDSLEFISSGEILSSDLPERILYWGGSEDVKNIIKIGSFNLKKKTLLTAIFPGKESGISTAAARGLVRVLPRENSLLSCRVIGIENYASSLFSLIAAELEREEEDVLFRGSRRLVRDFESVKPGMGNPVSLLKDQGTYLVFDNAQGLGMAFASWLAQKRNRKIFLCSDRDALSSGAPFTVLKPEGDNRVEEGFRLAGDSPVDAVFYTMDFPGNRAFETLREVDSKELQVFVQVLEKELGVLKEKCETLDFCLINSSLASLIGGAGTAKLSAAYSVIDRISFGAVEEGYNWININWDNWQLKESEEKGSSGLTPEKGMALLDSILVQGGPSSLMVSLSSLRERLQPGGGEIKEVQKVTFHDRPNLTSDFVPPRNDTEERLALIWQELVGVKPVGVYDNFFELGGHSLMAAQVISRVRDEFSMELPLTNLFDQPTVAFLGEYIDALHVGQKKTSGENREEGTI